MTLGKQTAETLDGHFEVRLRHEMATLTSEPNNATLINEENG